MNNNKINRSIAFVEDVSFKNDFLYLQIIYILVVLGNFLFKFSNFSISIRLFNF